MNIYSLLQEQRENRSKVYFKPQLSTQIKYSSVIKPQFINDSKIMYMSSYDFISYDIDEEQFNLINRPIPRQQTKNVDKKKEEENQQKEENKLKGKGTKLSTFKSSKQQGSLLKQFNQINSAQQQSQTFINVNFGKQSNETNNEIYYLTKYIQNYQQVYFLQRRANSITLDYSKRMIAKGKKIERKLDLNLLMDVDIKGISLKKILKKSQIENQKKIQEIKGKNKIQINQIIEQNVLEFQKQFIVKGQQNLFIFVIKKQLPSQSLQGSPQIKINKNEPIYSNDLCSNNSIVSSDFIKKSNNNYDQILNQNGPQPLNKQTKNILLLHAYKHNHSMTFQLDQDIDYAFQFSKSQPTIVCVTKKSVYLVRFIMVVKLSDSELKPLSSEQKNDKNHQNVNIRMQIIDKIELDFFVKPFKEPKKEKQQNQQSMEKKKNKHSMTLNNKLLRDRRITSVLAIQKQDILRALVVQTSDYSKPQQLIYQQLKIIKKIIYVVPINVNKQKFVLIIYIISKVLCLPELLETLSFHYEVDIQNIDSDQFVKANYQRQTSSNVDAKFGIQYAENEKDKANILEMIQQFGGITTNEGLILIWQKKSPIFYQIIFKIDTRSSEMMDISKPQNLSTQKSFKASTNYILEYKNKINLCLNYSCIREIIISPRSHNFLILTNKNTSKKKCQNSSIDSEDDCLADQTQQQYDIEDYLIFQYDLFSQLWSNDANIYLKSVYNCYKKRKIEEIIPYKMKNDVLILTGKRVHQLHKSLLEGILGFDVHPFGYFLVVSFGFNAKIYSIEHSTLNLIYTYNAQNIKKVKYSPNGSDIVIMNQKSIKILDAYSFSVKYILSDKNSQYSFTGFAYSEKGNFFYANYDSNYVSIHEYRSYKKVGSIKSGRDNFLKFNDKIISLIANQQEKFCLMLLEKGKIYMKFQEQVIMINHQQIYFYQDGSKIKVVHYDTKRKILFCGLQNGWVRSHIWPIKNQKIYSFENYSEFKFSYHQISALCTSELTNILYVGDSNGNVSISKFIIENQKKRTGQIRNNNFYIYSSYMPILNMPKTGLEALQKCYKFVLSSSTISLNDCPQRLKLQYKLNQILSRMGQQMTKYKNNIYNKLVEKQQFASTKLNFSKLYETNQVRNSQINFELNKLKERYEKQVEAEKVKYQQELKSVVEEQNKLIKEKGLELSKNVLGKAFLKKIQVEEHNELQQQILQISGGAQSTQQNQLNLIIQQQKLVPYNENDELPNWRANVKEEYLKKLNQDLVKEHQKNCELKSASTYLEKSRSNLQLSHLKQENLTFKINMELKQMESKLNFHIKVYDQLDKQLKQAQERINLSQGQIIQRNPLFTKVIQGTNPNDQCTYRLWVKDKYIQQVQLLYCHWSNLGQIMEQKQGDIIDMVNCKNKFLESIESLNQKKKKMKEYLHFLSQQLFSVKNKANEIKFKACKYEYFEQAKNEKKQRKISLNKVMKIKFEKKKWKVESHKKQPVALKPVQREYLDLESITQPSNLKALLKRSSVREKRNTARNFSLNIDKEMLLPLSFRNNIQDKKDMVAINLQQKIDKIVQDINHMTQVNPDEFYSNLEKANLNKLKSNRNKTVRLQDNFDKNKMQKTNSHNLSTQQVKEKTIPFSATSSPIIKNIIFQNNIYDKNSKYLKNNAKFHQLKVKKLNGEQGYLLGQFGLLNFENRQLTDRQNMIKQGINMLNELGMKKSHVQKSSQNQNKDNTFILTPFQKYIQHKSDKHGTLKTSNNFKQNILKSRASNTPRFKHYASAVSSPVINKSPSLLCSRISIKKL